MHTMHNIYRLSIIQIYHNGHYYYMLNYELKKD